MRDRVRVDPVMARRAYNQRLAPYLRHEHGPRGLAWSRRAQLLEAGDLVNCHRGAFVAQLADPRPKPQEKFPAGETDRDQAGVGNYRPPVLPQSDPAEARYQIPLAPARHPRFKTAPQAVAGDDLRPVTGGHLGDGRVVLGGQGLQHRRHGMPVQLAEPPDVLGEQVVVDDARVLGSVDPDDVVVVQVLQPGPGPRLAML